MVRCAHGGSSTWSSTPAPVRRRSAAPPRLDGTSSSWMLYVPRVSSTASRCSATSPTSATGSTGSTTPPRHPSVRYDDPDLAIAWPLPVDTLSPPDPVRGLVARSHHPRPPPLTRTVGRGSCRSTTGEVVLDPGDQPAADQFPFAADPGRTRGTRWPCGGAQGAGWPTCRTTAPRRTSYGLIGAPVAVRQAREAVDEFLGAGLLAPGDFIEFASPHGGSWGEALAARGFRPAPTARAGVVVDASTA